MFQTGVDNAMEMTYKRNIREELMKQLEKGRKMLQQMEEHFQRLERTTQELLH